MGFLGTTWCGWRIEATSHCNIAYYWRIEATATLPSKTQHPYSQHCLHGLMWYAYLCTCAVQKQLWSQLLETTVRLCPRMAKSISNSDKLRQCVWEKKIKCMKWNSKALTSNLWFIVEAIWLKRRRRSLLMPQPRPRYAKFHCEIWYISLILSGDEKNFPLIVVASCHWPNWSLWGCQPLWPWLLITLILDKQIEISALKIINTKALI